MNLSLQHLDPIAGLVFMIDLLDGFNPSCSSVSFVVNHA
jgi:hypothetical protein